MSEKLFKTITGKILVVDDEFINRELLLDILEEKGHTVELAENGQEALEKLNTFSPDLILLDIMMPGLNGFDVCKKIKEDPSSQHIPIIFTTALNRESDITTGLEMGATDFLSKPINPNDVVLRSRNAIFQKQLLDKEKTYVNELKELQKMNDELTHMIVHDLRNPLSGMVGYLDFLRTDFETSENDMHKKMIKIVLEQSERLNLMISSLLDVNKLEKGQMDLQIKNTNINDLFHRVLTLYKVNEKNIDFKFQNNSNIETYDLDENIIERVLENLITNAIKYSEQDTEINIKIESDNGKLIIKVIDQGPGIPESYQKTVFNKFTQVESEARKHKFSTGLGLTFCKLAVEAHGGEIGLYNNEKIGSTFWFSL